MRKDWEWFRHEIAELLFGKDLDEAYEQGIGVGAEFAAYKLSFEVNLKRNLKLTKVEARGYQHAIEVIERIKPEIGLSTGVKL